MVEQATLGFSSGHNLGVVGSSPVSGESGISGSLPEILSAPPLCTMKEGKGKKENPPVACHYTQSKSPILYKAIYRSATFPPPYESFPPLSRMFELHHFFLWSLNTPSLFLPQGLYVCCCFCINTLQTFACLVFIIQFLFKYHILGEAFLPYHQPTTHCCTRERLYCRI